MQNYYRFHLPYRNYIPSRKIIYYPNSSFINKPNNSCNSNFNAKKINVSENEEKRGKSSLENLPPNSDFVLDLFGLHLYFDDVLILGLLFFLYKEDVKDEGLFLALVMLLIS